MSTPVSHRTYQIIPWPEHAVSPQILYLHVGEDIPAAAARYGTGWQVITFGATDDVELVDTEQAARERLHTLGQAAVA